MSYYRVLQDVQSSPRRVQGVPIAALLERMRTEGVALLGLGVANRALLPFLRALAPHKVYLRTDTPPSGADAEALAALGACISVGAGFPSLPPVGAVLRSPSVRPDLPCLSAARAGGATVLTEVALSLALIPASLYCVTGSDGKTTTATITAEILRAAGRRVFLGGNIGTPLLPLLPKMRATDHAVLELSSFQLADLDPPCGRCAITGVSENHLDWHRDMAEYIAAKRRILGGGRAILPTGLFDDCAAVRFGDRVPPGCEAVTLLGDTVVHRAEGGQITPLFPRTALPLRGRHNLQNAMAAAALTLGTEPKCVAAAIGSLTGVMHRCTYLGRLAGCDCYDSSIDTTPARTLTTLRAMPAPPIVLLGGRNKGLSFASLAKALPTLSAGCVTFGECAPELCEAIANEAGDTFPHRRAGNLHEAVDAALAMAEGRHPILLSPAAASFDMFRNYRERGEAFSALLRQRDTEK